MEGIHEGVPGHTLEWWEALLHTPGRLPAEAPALSKSSPSLGLSVAVCNQTALTV